MNIAGGRETVKHLRLLAVLLLALCAGSKLLLSGGVELGKDEAAYVYWSQHLDATYALLPFALFGFFHWLAPGSEWVLRMGPILTGTLSLLLVYRLCRQHNLSRRAALMAAAALASSASEDKGHLHASAVVGAAADIAASTHSRRG